MTENERRHYQRIAFVADILIGKDEQQWQCELTDISLKGLLIVIPDELEPCLDDIYNIVLVLGQNATIKMQAKISHTDANSWGMQWKNIDIECFTHLRRLLELNSQDPEIVHRELSELGSN